MFPSTYIMITIEKDTDNLINLVDLKAIITISLSINNFEKTLFDCAHIKFSK